VPAALYTPEKFLLPISVRGNPRAIMRLEELGILKKKTLTSLGLESATFQLVA
jgi:hypothetical protein